MTAASIVLSRGFQLSSNEYDWLGDGVYFFQDARIRAWEWAQRFHDTQAAVLGARIRLEDCMDLLDIAWSRFLAGAYDSFMAKWKSSGRPLPVQKGGAHRMDRYVINYAVAVLAERGLKIRTVRAAFSEGKPVFPNSALMDHSHVQIAVRDTTLVEKVWSADDEKEIAHVDA